MCPGPFSGRCSGAGFFVRQGKRMPLPACFGQMCRLCRNTPFAGGFWDYSAGVFRLPAEWPFLCRSGRRKAVLRASRGRGMPAPLPARERLFSAGRKLRHRKRKARLSGRPGRADIPVRSEGPPQNYDENVKFFYTIILHFIK